MFDLDKAIAAWRHPFTYSRTVSAADLDEIERHLRDQVADLVAEGATLEEAFHETISEMGSLIDAEGEYGKVYWRKVQHQGGLWRELGARWSLIANYAKLAIRNLQSATQ